MNKCAHPDCNCKVQKPNDYCSEYCRTKGTEAGTTCNCGHADCK